MRKIMVAGAVAAAMLSASAKATTIGLSISTSTSGNSSFYTISDDFVLPANYTSASLHITSFSADDRAVAVLNGVVVDSTGIFGPGLGNFHFTATDPNSPFSFINGNGPQNLFITVGFVAGLNTFTLIVNDTFNGIFDDFVNGPNGPSGPTSLSITADVTYATVPEPASLAMLGLSLVALRTQSRRKVPAAR